MKAAGVKIWFSIVPNWPIHRHIIFRYALVYQSSFVDAFWWIFPYYISLLPSIILPALPSLLLLRFLNFKLDFLCCLVCKTQFLEIMRWMEANCSSLIVLPSFAALRSFENISNISQGVSFTILQTVKITSDILLI